MEHTVLWSTGWAAGESQLSRGLCLLTVPPVPCPADLSQVEITRAYLAKEADELSLQQADVVLVLGEEDGECWAGAGAEAGQGQGRGRLCPQQSQGRGNHQ